MPSSKILKQIDAARVAFDFNPRPFVIAMPEQAKDFLQAEGKRPPSGFKINELVASQIGLTKIESQKLEEKIEKLAIEKAAEIQEEAYREAYELGQKEGQKDAYESVRADLDDKIEKFSDLIMTISNLKKELVSYNEAHVVKLVAAIAGKVAMQHINENKDAILPILSSALEEAQEEERVMVRVSRADMEFIDSLGETFKQKVDMAKNIKFEIDEDMQRGGCVVETNYGTIDASIEQRVNKLWEHFADKVPPVKERAG